jgi:hypothetical protein
VLKKLRFALYCALGLAVVLGHASFTVSLFVSGYWFFGLLSGMLLISTVKAAVVVFDWMIQYRL